MDDLKKQISVTFEEDVGEEPQKMTVEITQAEDDLEEVGEPEKYEFKFNKVLCDENEESRIRSEVGIKQLQYTRHEFVKTSEVNAMITEAIQTVFDRLHQKEKAALGQKA